VHILLVDLSKQAYKYVFNKNFLCLLLTQNLHLAPSTQQAEQAGFTREEITRCASQFSLKINKRQSS
jgi:hypothetical protein